MYPASSPDRNEQISAASILSVFVRTSSLLGKTLDAGRINHADHVTSIMKIDRQLITIITRSFHAGMDFLNPLLLKLETQHLKTFFRIPAGLMLCLSI
ncbi:MAG: hypothetical protein JW902_10700 [Syntrophaceae bacterium]|nr:hypothetical protein [Syntrophaceae bacterium]